MKRRMNWLGRAGLALVAAGMLQGLASPAMAQSKDSVTFGFFAPLTGRFGANGERFKEAVNLFVEQTNAGGGIGGKPLVVLTEDDRGEIFAAAGVPQVSPSSSHPDYTKISKFQFRIPNTQDTMSLKYVSALEENAPHKRVAVIYFQDDWGIFVGNATKAALEKDGSEVPVFEAMLPDARDFRPLVTKLRQANVDSILLASHYGPSAIFLQQLRQAGLDQTVVGPETLYNPELITLAGDAANGVITTTYFFPGDPTKVAFVDAYKAKYGREPDLWAAYAYDAIAIATAGAKALADAGKPITREALRDAIADLPPYEGVTGTTKFVNGTPAKDLTILKITDGAYTLLK